MSEWIIPCEADGFTPNRKLLDTMVDMGLAGGFDDDGKKIGLVLGVGGCHKNVITFAPSLHISSDEIDLGMKLLDQLPKEAKVATKT